jgi:hypothetical protein
MLCCLSAGCHRAREQAIPGAPFPTRQHITATGATATAANGYNMGAPVAPDPAKTPGDVLPVTPADFCTTGYTAKVRNVPESVKKKVYAAYGITSRKPREYEVDHLISLELSGSNSIKNLWPESYMTKPWNARDKSNALEYAD